MSYQVLARKWRPNSFQSMVGQEHVLRALVNALDSNRLHHAYLFTGTRGVGKTTIGRIFAKCLNCEQGIVSTPCGTCSACCEISEGRFVDLIEIDAASRTKVEDMRELLDNVQYSPTRGRFKVYLIDEVHMLSASSFNALLKTLEEPPPHVKFLLATTDPQKLPVTILSRCLQFNLKNMSPDKIVSHLEFVLSEENIPFDKSALWLLARAADGSMRDALSLTDQAIAFGGQSVNDTDVSSMLGTVNQKHVFGLVRRVVERNPKALLALVEEMSEFAPDYSNVLSGMVGFLHRVAVEQMVPGITDNSQGDESEVKEVAKSSTAEDIQLMYQIALVGRKDLALVSDARAGLEMVLLRMIAFQPDVTRQISRVEMAETEAVSEKKDEPAVKREQQKEAENSAVQPEETPSTTETSDKVTEPVEAKPLLTDGQHTPEAGGAEQVDVVELVSVAEQIDESPSVSGMTAQESLDPVSHEDMSAYAAQLCGEVDENVYEASIQAPHPYDAIHAEPSSESVSHSVDNTVDKEGITVSPQSDVTDVSSGEVYPESPLESEPSSNEWADLFETLGLSGLTYSLASHSNASINGDSVHCLIAEGQYRLFNETHQKRMTEALCTRLGKKVSVNYTAGKLNFESPFEFKERKKAERQASAVFSLHSDEGVGLLKNVFSAQLLENTVEPLEN